MSTTGSYHNGFAPRDGQPLYPELWRGCVGAWAPCLGTTGLTLREWSSAVKHGTLTNMDPGTDWVVSGGRYSLDFDGSNDHVRNTDFTFPASGSLAVWMYSRDMSSIASDGLSAVSNQDAYINIAAMNNTITGSIYNAGYHYTTYAAVVNRWYHAVLTWNGSNASQLFVDGILRSTSTGTNAGNPSVRTIMNIGSRGSGGFFNGLTDDIRVYSRVLSANEIRVLSCRRGISYELSPRRKVRLAAFRAAWAARKAQIIGGGVN